ncbi:hypothetical protein [Poriferisphaera sp. WC338]|uniref:hypothetical protein n=1 Tax=Poriferisphaera sp. WC338 TaxID=3425129 RepID=UPI003D81A75A
MPVSGLNLTISDDPKVAVNLKEAIACDDAFTLGLHQGVHLAVVLETEDKFQDKAKHQWLSSLAGLAHIDVVFIHFDDDEDAVYLKDSPSLSADMA